ncbi:MAG: hypothetical protein IPO22_19425, partial [Anaerolineales bacterium]|nr:hypothetical protein [Anaerolineales bacterium]
MRLIIKGDHVRAGYWNTIDATTQPLRDGWFHTGDMRAWMKKDILHCWPFQRMTISGGENVHCRSGSTFREHPAVADAALIGEPDEKWGEVGLMIV